MRQKNLMKRLDNLVFKILGCASIAGLVCLMFCPSCRNRNERQPEQEQILQEEFYEPLDNLPKSKSDSVSDSRYLIAEQEA